MRRLTWRPCVGRPYGQPAGWGGRTKRVKGVVKADVNIRTMEMSSPELKTRPTEYLHRHVSASRRVTCSAPVSVTRTFSAYFPLPSTKGELCSIPGGGQSQIFACGNRVGLWRWSAGFLWNLPFPPLLHSDAAPYSPHFILFCDRHSTALATDICSRKLVEYGRQADFLLSYMMMTQSMNSWRTSNHFLLCRDTVFSNRKPTKIPLKTNLTLEKSPKRCTLVFQSLLGPAMNTRTCVHLSKSVGQQQEEEVRADREVTLHRRQWRTSEEGPQAHTD
ncbi:hypothetical protein PR048_018056 [Dryococelus australis]|uniref:Uncharacterized protein n=1 Tax=Dryococelus australis TaxID=614101 RepID=A0ABQ9HBC0_9NEOP|nr:hypothetical protein PR048_018056 [Dryococelus australis]